MEKKLRWIHLSDIHFNYLNYRTQKMKDELLKRLARLGSQSKFDFLVITGDMVFQSGPYTQDLTCFIQVIAKTLNLDILKQVYIVPGNHDLKRSPSRSAIIESVLKSSNPMEEASELSDDKLKELLKDQRAYFQFVKRTTGKSHPKTNLHFIEERDTYRIVHINTCILSGKKNEEGSLYIGNRKLYNVLRGVPSDSRLNIAIGHHSLECISPKEREQIVQNLSDCNVDLYLCGHMHNANLHAERDIPFFTCGAGIVNDYAKANFLVGEVNLTENIGRMTYYSWSEDSAHWYLDNSIDRRIRDGCINFDLSRFNRCGGEINSDRRSSFFPGDETLLLSNSDIEKNIYPKVDNYIERMVIEADVPETNFFGLENKKDLLDIIIYEKLIVLLGDAGVGKSTELDRVAGYYSEKKGDLYPYKLMLKDYVNQKIEELLPDSWTAIPLDQVLLILDGFDEIESKNKNDAIRQIKAFCDKYKKVKVLVSCRSNFYKLETSTFPGTLPSFKSYRLVGLTREQIDVYVEKNLGAKTRDFFRELVQKQMCDLIEIPFYLTKLVEIFKFNNNLPKSRAELFEELLYGRIRLDAVHFQNTVDLLENQETLSEHLEYLALSMETLERNYITDIEFQRIIPALEMRTLVKCCSEFKKIETKNGVIWQFGHNNFQEYLAAKRLMVQPLEVIKDFIAFKPEYSKVKPSWVNTLSFLLSLRTNGDLLDWVLIIEPELAIKFEPDKLDSLQRKNTFINIFEHYKDRLIPIDLEKYRLGELGRFAQTPDIISYLIEEIKTSKHQIVIENALLILNNIKPISLINEIQDVLVQKCINGHFGQVSINRALITLANWELNTGDTIKSLINELSASDSDWVRYGLYYFLAESDLLDEYVDIFIDGIKFCRRDTTVSEGRLGNESFQLKIGLEKLHSSESIIKVVTHFIQNPYDIANIFYEKDLDKFIKNIVGVYNQDDDFDNVIFNLYIALFNAGEEAEARIVSRFFHQTDTNNKFFIKVLDGFRDNGNFYELLALIADESSIDFYVRQYEDRNITNDDVACLVNQLRRMNPQLSSRLIVSANKINGNKIQIEEPKDYEQLREIKHARDFDMLFNKETFIKNIEYVFENQGKAEIEHDELLHMENYRWDDESHSELVFRFLYHFDNIVRLDDIKQWLNTNWDAWSINRVYEILSHSKEINLSDEKREILEKYCIDNYAKVNFKTAFEEKEGTYSYNDHVAVKVWMFYRHLQLELPKSVLLDMLSFDWIDGDGFAGIEYLEEKLTLTEITIRILQNLEEGCNNNRILINYLRFAQRHEVIDIVPFAIKLLADNNSGDELREVALSMVLKLKTDIKILLDILPIVNGSFRWKLSAELLDYPEAHDVLIKYLKRILDIAEEEDCFAASDLLLKLQDMAGLEYLARWMKTNKRTPFNISDYALGQFRQMEAIPTLLGLYELSYDAEFAQEKYYRLSSMVLDALAQIATTSESAYLEVKSLVQTFINNKYQEMPNVNYLHVFLDRLERRYYISKSETISISDVKNKVSTLFN